MSFHGLAGADEKRSWAFRMCNDGSIWGEKILFERRILPLSAPFSKHRRLDNRFAWTRGSELQGLKPSRFLRM